MDEIPEDLLITDGWPFECTRGCNNFIQSLEVDQLDHVAGPFQVRVVNPGGFITPFVGNRVPGSNIVDV
jgi:hypothetical protein